MEPDRPRECSNCEFWSGRKENAAPLQSASCKPTVNTHGVLIRGTMAHADAELPTMCWLETQAEFYCNQWEEVMGA